MLRSETDLRIQDLKIQVLGLLRRLEEALATSADANRATVEALDARARQAYLDVGAASDGEAYIALTEVLRDLLAMGLGERPADVGGWPEGAREASRVSPSIGPEVRSDRKTPGSF